MKKLIQVFLRMSFSYNTSCWQTGISCNYFQADRKLIERVKATHKKELEARDMELAQLRSDSTAASSQKIQELQSQIDSK